MGFPGIVRRFIAGHTRGMEHHGTVIRPPSEADSILLQVTLGCSHGKCAFCGAYRDKPFAVRPPEDIEADLRWVAAHMPRHRRLFLCDGDVLALPMHRLEALLDLIGRTLPGVKRVSSYASARNLRGKSDEELLRLREAGLRMVYMGLESGDQGVLERMGKGSSVEDIVRAGKRIVRAGLKLNVTVLNGLGGVEGSAEHARKTAQALTEMNPHQIAALSLMPIPGTPLWDDIEAGRFILPDADGMVAELREMVAGLDDYRGLLLANHASNHAPFRARMPADRERIMALLDESASGKRPMRPEWSRRL